MLNAWFHARLDATSETVLIDTKIARFPKSQKAYHNDSPSSTSHVAFQKDRPQSTLIIHPISKPSTHGWLFHRYRLKIDLVIHLHIGEAGGSVTPSPADTPTRRPGASPYQDEAERDLTGGRVHAT